MQPKWKWSSIAFGRCRVTDKNTNGKMEEDMWIKIAPNPFAQGTSRIARHGRLLTATGWGHAYYARHIIHRRVL